MKIIFEILTGIAAKDYSDLAKRDNLQPIELNLQKLEDMMGYLFHELNTIMSSEEKNKSLDLASEKIIIFSIATLSAIIFVSLLELIYIKKYFKNRKLI